jgi:hypothetical protein
VFHGAGAAMKVQSPLGAITKMRTGIQGFDEITNGGLPRGRSTLVVGGPGCGKTVFALQALVNGARLAKEASVFVAFEESTTQIVANAATFGWDLQALQKNRLFFLDARLAPDVVRAGEFDLDGMLAMIEAKAKEIDAKRVVFDGIDVLLGLPDNPVEEPITLTHEGLQLTNRGPTELKYDVTDERAFRRAFRGSKTEMEARSSELAVLALATGSASDLVRTDRAVLRKMRHADAEIRSTERSANGVSRPKRGRGDRTA